MGNLHICRPIEERREVREMACPTCEAVTPQLCSFYEWYGWSVTCIGCGDRWQDGEMCPRPFAPRWRKMSIQDALARLRTAVYRKKEPHGDR